MYRIAICDDNKNFAGQLHDYVQKLCTGNAVSAFLKLYTDSDELMDLIRSGKYYDLYILDVIMPAYSGMDLLELLDERDVASDVIILSSYTDYAVEACGYKQVFRYIPKGLYKKRLEAALRDYFTKMNRKQGSRPYIIQNKKKSVKFYQEDVAYIYKDGKYVVFSMKTGEEERERSSLSELYEKLQNPDMVMLDRGCIVNILHVSRIQANEVELETGHLIHTSRENIQKLKTAFSMYWGNLI